MSRFRNAMASIHVLAAAALVAAPAPARAGAWTQPPGVAYVRFAGAAIDAARRFDGSGRLVPYGGAGATPARYGGRELRLYAEYGLREAVTLYGSAVYKGVRLEQGGAVSENVGVSDLVAAARVRLRGGGAPLAIAFEVQVPSGYARDGTPALGPGEAQVTARGLWGAGLGRAYATADAAFTYRAGGYRNEVSAGAETGGRLLGPVTARVTLRAARALGSPGDRVPAATFDPSLTSPRRLEWGLVAGLDLGGGTALEVGRTRVLSGRDVLAGDTLELALVMAFGGAPSRDPAP